MAAVVTGVSPPVGFWLSSESGALTVVTPALIAVMPMEREPFWPGARVRAPEPVIGWGTAPKPPTRVSPPWSRGLVTVTLALETSPTCTLPKSKLVWDRVGVTRASTGDWAEVSETSVPPWPSLAVDRP